MMMRPRPLSTLKHAPEPDQALDLYFIEVTWLNDSLHTLKKLLGIHEHQPVMLLAGLHLLWLQITLADEASSLNH